MFHYFFMSNFKCNSFEMMFVLLILSFASQVKQKRTGGSKETHFFSLYDCWDDPSQTRINNYD